MDDSNIIQVADLKKSYQLPRKARKNSLKIFQALKGISFNVKKGEIFGILGPNGAGKSSTLEIIESLKHQNSGTVKVMGFDNLENGDEIKKRIGVQLQSSGYLPYLSLRELLELFGSLYKNNTKVDVAESLQFVGLKEKEHEQFEHLSGGQKQRFTIATALINKPSVIFLDEPTTGLDPAARRQIWQLIKTINSQGTTIVLTTHYMEEAEFLCHRVAIMDEGKILEIDEPQQLIEEISRTTQISFLTDQQINKEIFSRVEGIDKIYENYPKIILETSTLDNISQIVQTLKTQKVKFSGFTVKTASLEDVYLDLTGREFIGNKNNHY